MARITEYRNSGKRAGQERDVCDRYPLRVNLINICGPEVLQTHTLGEATLEGVPGVSPFTVTCSAQAH